MFLNYKPTEEFPVKVYSTDGRTYTREFSEDWSPYILQHADDGQASYAGPYNDEGNHSRRYLVFLSEDLSVIKTLKPSEWR